MAPGTGPPRVSGSILPGEVVANAETCRDAEAFLLLGSTPIRFQELTCPSL